MYLLIVQALGLNDDREISRKDLKGGAYEQIHGRIREYGSGRERRKESVNKYRQEIT